MRSGDPVAEAISITIRRTAAAAAAEALGLTPEVVLKTVRTYAEQVAIEQRKADRLARRGIVTQAREDHETRLREDRGGDHLPTKERRKQGDVIEGETFLPGSDTRTVKARLAQDPIDRFLARKIITKRQEQAASKLRADYETGIVGVKASRDLLATGSGGRGSVTLSEAQHRAGDSYSKAVQKVGTMLLPVVLNVVCQGKDLRDLGRPDDYKLDEKKRPTRELKSAVQARLMWQLRRGLDLLAEFYRLESDEVAREEIVAGEPPRSIVITYRHEANGRVSGVFFGNTPWLADAPTLGQLRDKATARLEREAK